MSNLILFQVQDPTGNPVPKAVLNAENSVVGNWAGTCDNCGKFPATLAPGHYDVTITAPGYHSRIIPMDLADSGIITIGLELDFPPAPNRDEVLKARIPFQGFRANTSEFGAFNSFGVETSVLNDADLAQHCQDLKDQGFTHAMMCISWRYFERDYQYPVPGRDATSPTQWADIRRRIEFIVQRGLKVVFFLAGDGLSAPKNADGSYPYNDPQGWTYGYEWLMEWFPKFANYINGSRTAERDLSKYILFFPGFDGVFYGWSKPETPDLQPMRVINFGRMFRQALPNGYLGIEHTPGNIPVGEGQENWKTNGDMDAFDVLLSEFNKNLREDTCWQIVARFVAIYYRPADQTTPDSPTYYFIQPSSRGPRVYIRGEFKTYWWVRDQVSLDQVNEDRNYLQSMGEGIVC